jgi:hypothetical protein
MYEHLTTRAEKKKRIIVPEKAYINTCIQDLATSRAFLKQGPWTCNMLKDYFRISTLAPEITHIQKVVCRTVVFGRLVSTVLSRRVVAIWITTPYHLRKLILKG